MAALATLAVVWLGAEKPEGKAKAALDAWAAARSFALESPRTEPDDGGEAARAVAERCEQKLEQARDQLNAGDDGAARQTLATLEQALRDHPELLQASWLMAERYRLEGQIAARLGESAAVWQERAETLEGERAPAFGEARRSSAERPSVPVTIAVHGARAHETFWDGARTDDAFSTGRGEHHLAIVRGKRVAWSGWVSALLATRLDVWIADAPPCSAEDLEGAAFAGASEVRPPSGVRCPAWAVAGPGAERGTIRAALCQRADCQRASTWAYEIFSPSGSTDATKKGFPPWATWTMVGVGVAAATSIILWQSGVFDRPEPTRKVIYDGSGL
jgi:hypothetical protein